MRFTTAGFRQTYVLAPPRHRLVAETGLAWREYTPLSISSGSSRTLDTDIAAEMNGWTPEEKEQMERHLMSHPDFGTKRNVDRGEQRGDDLLNSTVWVLWFAPDQDIPERYEEFCAQQSWFERWGSPAVIEEQAAKVSDRLCMFTTLVDGKVFGCREQALVDQNYCEEHATDMAGVVV